MEKFQTLIKGILFAAVLSLAVPAEAKEWQPFDRETFQEAQIQEKTIVLDFHADWCPTCRKQEAVLGKIFMKEEFEDVVGLTVNFDTATDLKKELNVTKQSTLIVFKGNEEVTRTMGVTAEGDIEALIKKGM